MPVNRCAFGMVHIASVSAARPVAFLATLLLAGCSSLLPRGSSDMPSSFASYEAASAAAAKIVPFRTTLAELPALGFDPRDGHNVTVIPYPDIVARLAPYGGVPLEQLDEGIRECILARTRCQGYVFQFRREDRRREGSFVADFLNVHRSTKVTGWSFEMLVVTDGERVLFRNVGGQARIERVEKQTNPLGPLQRAGESAGNALIR